MRKLILPTIALLAASAQATEIPQFFSARQKTSAQQVKERFAELSTAVEHANGLALVEAKGFVFPHYEAIYRDYGDTDQTITFVDSLASLLLPANVEARFDELNFNENGVSIAGMLRFRISERWAVSGEIKSFGVDFGGGFKVPIGVAVKGQYRF
jgi:hypothetical protein